MIQKKSVKLSKYKFAKLTLEVFDRDGHRCQLPDHKCHGLLAPHHIIPKARLRLDILENLLTSCWAGHRLLHDGLLNVSVDDLIDQHGLRHYLHSGQENNHAGLSN